MHPSEAILRRMDARPPLGIALRVAVGVASFSLLPVAACSSDDPDTRIEANSAPDDHGTAARRQPDLDCDPADRIIEYSGQADTSSGGGDSPAEAIAQWRHSVPSPATIDADANLADGSDGREGWSLRNAEDAHAVLALFVRDGRTMSRITFAQGPEGGWFVAEEATCNELLAGHVLAEDELVDPRQGE